MEEPILFYKYKSLSTDEDINRIKEILVDNSIYLPKLLQLNDPFDCRPLLQRIYVSDPMFKSNLCWRYKNSNTEARYNEMIEQFENDQEGLERNLNSNMEFFALIAPLSIRLFCVSSIYNSIPMWAYYADSFRGICLEFNSEKDPDFFQNIYQVNYSENHPIINHYEPDDDKAKKALLTKFKEWDHEKEWRLIFYNQHEEREKIKPEAITGIYFGLDMTLEKRELIMEMANRMMVKPKLFNGFKLKCRFGIEFCEIPY